MGALDLDLALFIHGGFEGIVGILLLIEPKWVFPYIAARASYNNSERALLRWFAFSIITQALVCAASLKFDSKSKRYVLTAFLAYHIVIVLDSLFGYWKEETLDEIATGLHSIMASLVGFFLFSGSQRAARSSPKKR